MPGAPPPPKPPRPGAPPRAGAPPRPPRPPGPPGPPRPPGPPGPPRPPGALPKAAGDLGIIAGLGRGIPSRPRCGRGGRWSLPPAPGAGAPPGVGAGRLPMPCVEENGLLPGRGAPGRAGRGPGLKPEPALAAGAAASSPPSVSCLSGGLGRGVVLRLGGRLRGLVVRLRRSLDDLAGTGSRLEEGLGRRLGGSRLRRCRGRLRGGGVDRRPRHRRAAAAFLAGAFLAAFLAAFSSALVERSAPYLSSNRFTTGGSTVELGAFTNSPRSLSIDRTSFDGTSYFLASSWTRTLATCFLLVRIPVPSGSCGPLVDVHAHRAVLSARVLIAGS